MLSAEMTGRWGTILAGIRHKKINPHKSELQKQKTNSTRLDSVVNLFFLLASQPLPDLLLLLKVREKYKYLLAVCCCTMTSPYVQCFNHLWQDRKQLIQH